MKVLRYLMLILLLAGLALYLYAPYMDRYDPGGETLVDGLTAPVRILRDDKGIPYVFADNFDDVIFGQGFATAQDRLFQLDLWRRLAYGRLSELVGEAGLSMDRQVLLFDIPDLARRQVALLSETELAFQQAYVDGINAYISERPEEHPLAVGAVSPWTVQDVMAIQLFRVWGSTTNWREELLSQALIDKLGVERAASLSQVTINPDAESAADHASSYDYLRAGVGIESTGLGTISPPDGRGSNSWATGPRRSAGGMPIVSSDPHLDSRQLPGFWYPVGLVTPGFRAVGGGTPGTPGLGIGRTDAIAWGVTNGYGDIVDLYIEREDPQNPDHYLEGEQSVPFLVREETLRIKDDSAEGGVRQETMRIRQTRRGAIISEHGFGADGGSLISLRWAVAEFAGPELGLRELLLARNVDEALNGIGKLAIPLTYIVADLQGDIVRVGAGYLPRRLRGDGAAPFPVIDGVDNWDGRIPGDEMPLLRNPEAGWVGSANHRIVPPDYPYHYSTYFAHSWRYRRLSEAMAADDSWTVDDHWALMHDVKNMLAERLAPLMVAALLEDDETRGLAEVLQAWDFNDRAEEAAPLVFQSVLRHYVYRLVVDELGDELAREYLSDYYYWHERLTAITLGGDSDWIDDIRTDPVETREQLMVAAGRDTLAELTPGQGDDPASWRWGDVHTISFKHPLLRQDWATRWLGGGTHPKSGSGETLSRAAYRYNKPYGTAFMASLHWTADLNDEDKVVANFPGGQTDRLFHPHSKDQLQVYLAEEQDYWWFSDQAIGQHAVSELRLVPR